MKDVIFGVENNPNPELNQDNSLNMAQIALLCTAVGATATLLFLNHRQSDKRFAYQQFYTTHNYLIPALAKYPVKNRSHVMSLKKAFADEYKRMNRKKTLALLQAVIENKLNSFDTDLYSMAFQFSPLSIHINTSSFIFTSSEHHSSIKSISKSVSLLLLIELAIGEESINDVKEMLERLIYLFDHNQITASSLSCATRAEAIDILDQIETLSKHPFFSKRSKNRLYPSYRSDLLDKILTLKKECINLLHKDSISHITEEMKKATSKAKDPTNPKESATLNKALFGSASHLLEQHERMLTLITQADDVFTSDEIHSLVRDNLGQILSCLHEILKNAVKLTNTEKRFMCILVNETNKLCKAYQHMLSPNEVNRLSECINLLYENMNETLKSYLNGEPSLIGELISTSINNKVLCLHLATMIWCNYNDTYVYDGSVLEMLIHTGLISYYTPSLFKRKTSYPIDVESIKNIIDAKNQQWLVDFPQAFHQRTLKKEHDDLYEIKSSTQWFDAIEDEPTSPSSKTENKDTETWFDALREQPKEKVFITQKELAKHFHEIKDHIILADRRTQKLFNKKEGVKSVILHHIETLHNDNPEYFNDKSGDFSRQRLAQDMVKCLNTELIANNRSAEPIVFIYNDGHGASVSDDDNDSSEEDTSESKLSPQKDKGKASSSSKKEPTTENAVKPSNSSSSSSSSSASTVKPVTMGSSNTLEPVVAFAYGDPNLKSFNADLRRALSIARTHQQTVYTSEMEALYCLKHELIDLCETLSRLKYLQPAFLARVIKQTPDTDPVKVIRNGAIHCDIHLSFDKKLCLYRHIMDQLARISLYAPADLTDLSANKLIQELDKPIDLVFTAEQLDTMKSLEAEHIAYKTEQDKMRASNAHRPEKTLECTDNIYHILVDHLDFIYKASQIPNLVEFRAQNPNFDKMETMIAAELGEVFKQLKATKRKEETGFDNELSHFLTRYNKVSEHPRLTHADTRRFSQFRDKFDHGAMPRYAEATSSANNSLLLK